MVGKVGGLISGEEKEGQPLPLPAILNIPTQLGSPVEKKAGSSYWERWRGCAVLESQTV